MARLSVSVLVGLVLATAGCGDGAQSPPGCDDAAFRAQDEELYVARAAADNAARGGGATNVLADDLTAGAGALERVLRAAVPCDEHLAALAARERRAAAEMRVAARHLEQGRTARARAVLDGIVADLAATEQDLHRDA